MLGGNRVFARSVVDRAPAGPDGRYTEPAAGSAATAMRSDIESWLQNQARMSRRLAELIIEQGLVELADQWLIVAEWSEQMLAAAPGPGQSGPLSPEEHYRECHAGAVLIHELSMEHMELMREQSDLADGEVSDLEGLKLLTDLVAALSTAMAVMTGAGVLGLAAAPTATATLKTTLLGAGIGGSVKLGGVALANAMAELTDWSNEAVDELDEIAFATWEGFRDGAIDGVLAPLGVMLEATLTPTMLGRALIDRKAALVTGNALKRLHHRAVATMPAGGIIGALDTGLRAAAEGKSVDDIINAMTIGVIEGMAGGAVVGFAAEIPTTRLIEKVHELLLSRLQEIRQSLKASDLTDELRARLLDVGAPAAVELAELVPVVSRSLDQPELWVQLVDEATAGIHHSLETMLRGSGAMRQEAAEQVDHGLEEVAGAAFPLSAVEPEGIIHELFESAEHLRDVLIDRSLNVTATLAKVGPGAGPDHYVDFLLNLLVPGEAGSTFRALANSSEIPEDLRRIIWVDWLGELGHLGPAIKQTLQEVLSSATP